MLKVRTDASTVPYTKLFAAFRAAEMEETMKKLLSLILVAALVLSLAGCGDVLVDLETPKSAELSAKYDFYSDSMNTTRNRMGITPEQADEVFLALIDSGLDGKVTLVTKKDDGYKVSWGANSLEVVMNDDGTVSEISDGKNILYPEYKQHNFLLDCDVKTADVKSGSGDVIGQRAFVSVLKSQLAELTAENFAEFAETIVKDSGYNYFTIKCDDGTGIVFPGSMCYVSHYCQLDDDGAMLENYGTITLDENGVCNYESSETSNEIKSLVLSVIPAEYQDKPSFSVDVLSQSDGGYSVTIQIDVDSAEYRSIANDIYNDFVALPNSNLSVHTFDFLIVSDGALIDNFSLPE